MPALNFSKTKAELPLPVSTFFDACIFNFNRNIPNENVTHCIALLPWFEEINLVGPDCLIVGIYCPQNAYVNGMSQQALIKLFVGKLRHKYQATL